MRALAATAVLLFAAGCDRQAPPGNETAPVAPSPTTEAAAPPAPNGQPIGQTSALTGQTSALTGVVSGFQVSRTATETRVLLAADTLFAFDKADLSAEANANLQRTAEVVAESKGDVRVVGHTDGKGDDAYNDALSKRRADAVAAWLRSQPSLAGRSFVTEGHGKREPLMANTTPDGHDAPEARARNRRVEVIVGR